MINELNRLYDEGLLLKQTHPTHPLIIWNYSATVQYGKLWTPLLMMCRGLVTDFDGNIIARSFPKFFNYEEHETEEIPNEPFEVFEKMDGSLIICFYYKGDWICASRGSFTSEQAIKANEMFKNLSIIKNYPTTGLNHNCSYLFEIIYSENRIVCEYPFEGLVLLGAYENNYGNEVDFETLKKQMELFDDIKIVRKYHGISDYNVLKETISDDREGYVIRFKSGFRLKIKGNEYVRLHKIITNVSNRDIWEYLKENKPLDELLEKVPDEFYNWVRDTVTELKTKFETIKMDVENDFKELIDKKEFAEKIKNNPNKSFLFKRLNSYSNQLDDMIWDSIYPKFSKPFKNSE